MPGKRSSKKAQPAEPAAPPRRAERPSALLDTRIVYCGDYLDSTEPRPSGSGSFPPDGCVDRLYLWHRFPTGDSNSNRNYEVFWGETKEKRAFEDRHASTAAYIDYMRPCCVELARVLKKSGSFYYHCDWHSSTMPSDRSFGLIP